VEQFNADWRRWATAMRAVDRRSRSWAGDQQFFASPTSDYEINSLRQMTEL
jgi:hypothetical protein